MVDNDIVGEVVLYLTDFSFF